MTEAKAEYSTDNVIRFTAQVQKVQTLSDMGIRITLDLPESAIDVASAMMHVKQAGAMLEVVAVAVNE